jgi:hypothetical protein
MFPRFLFLSLSAALVHAQEPAPPTPPPTDAKDPHHHQDAAAGIASAGRNMELVKGLTDADFLRLGAEPKTVELIVVAVWNDENYGMNFNGYAKGNATYTIPKDWKVSVKYINPSPIPHSLLVVEKDSLKKIQMPEPYFKGAAVPDFLKGLAYGTSTFTFVADEAGDYALACGFPAHALNGHWIALEISGTATAPTLTLGTGEPKPASPAKAK